MFGTKIEVNPNPPPYTHIHTDSLSLFSFGVFTEWVSVFGIIETHAYYYSHIYRAEREKSLYKERGASIPRSTELHAANRAEVKGQSCNIETIDGANIPLTLRGGGKGQKGG